MSSVYIKEPDFSGKVVLETTHGQIEIQLWCRECRETTRLFLQLCSDGFYDDMLIHRIVPGFLMQTGAIRQKQKENSKLEDYLTSVNAEAALERRRYELNSRIRFTHRGRVSMALQVDEDDPENLLQPQFFITLDEAPYLDGKHVCFGSVAGPTIFNAVRIGQHEVTDDNAPVDLIDAPRIKSVKIVENPIHKNIVQISDVPWKEKDVPKVKKKKKRKGKLDVNVLSFGDEFEEAAPTTASASETKKAPKEKKKHVRESKEDQTSDDEKPSFNAPLIRPESRANALADSSSSRYIPSARNVAVESPRPETPEPIKDKKQEKEKKKKVSYVEAQRAKYAKLGKGPKKKRQHETMEKLLAFQSKVKEEVTTAKLSTKGDNSLASRMARRSAAVVEKDREGTGDTYHGQVLEDDTDEKGSAWLSTRFQCKRHMDHKVRDLAGDGRSAHDYKVVDSRAQDDHASKRGREKRDNTKPKKKRHKRD